jgi:hypothetical protein
VFRQSYQLKTIWGSALSAALGENGTLARFYGLVTVLLLVGMVGLHPDASAQTDSAASKAKSSKQATKA